MTDANFHEPGDGLSRLDNPVWHALVTAHASFAEGDDLAKRYPPAVTPQAALREESPACYASLARILGPGGRAGVFLNAPPASAADLTVERVFHAVQMVCTNPALTDDGHTITPLGHQATPEMFSLVELTQPGPFAQRTPELGTYLGIFESGRLVAMAGERVRIPGLAEISLVCTHPEFRGRGYASSLVSAVARQMMARGETPFLHVLRDNTGAIRVYEKLGFARRRQFQIVVLKGA